MDEQHIRKSQVSSIVSSPTESNPRNLQNCRENKWGPMNHFQIESRSPQSKGEIASNRNVVHAIFLSLMIFRFNLILEMIMLTSSWARSAKGHLKGTQSSCYSQARNHRVANALRLRFDVSSSIALTHLNCSSQLQSRLVLRWFVRMPCSQLILPLSIFIGKLLCWHDYS